MKASIRTKVVLGLVVVCLIWGSTWLAIKVGLRTVTPFLAASLRFFIAALLLFAISRIRGSKSPLGKRFWSVAILLSLLSFSIPFALVYWGQSQIPSSLASILFATFPFSVALFSHFRLPDEPMTLAKGLGIVSGFSGVYIIFASELTFASELAEWGMLAIVASAVMQAYALVSFKKYGKGLDLVRVNLAAMTIGGILLFLVSLFTEQHDGVRFDNLAILSLIYLSVFGSVVTFLTYFWLVKHVDVVLLSLTAFVTPIIAVLLGTLVLRESLAPQVLAGSTLVLGGILIANSPDVLTLAKRGKAWLLD
ncbi:MAG TPA: EamA family transporter [Bacteroidota bacterium]|nr:EamA family transporter [Bacteroidota bacterium]